MFQFTIGELRQEIKLIFQKMWVWYLEKQANLKKWSEILKKNDLCDQKAQDQDMLRRNGLYWVMP